MAWSHNFIGIIYLYILNTNSVDLYHSRLIVYSFSDVYLATVQPQPQHVVIVMDHGNSLSSNQLKTAKGIAKQFLNSLSERDRVS